MEELAEEEGRAVWPRAWKAVAALVVCMLVATSGFLVGFAYTWARTPRHPAGNPVDLEVFWQAWGYIQKYFYGTTPAGSTLTYGAIDGALGTLGDPYTRLVRPVASEIEDDSLRGSFGGIGAYVYEDEGLLYLRPLVGSAAERAGIREGDRLVAVDDYVLPNGTTVDQAVALVRGPIGEVVRIGIHRTDTGEDLSFDIRREEVTQPTVGWQMLEGYEPSAAIITITLFGERTADELRQALAGASAAGAEAVLLDLRGNPGGLLEAAVDAASIFLDEGVILYEVDATGEERVFTVRDGERYQAPVAILVDENTASAAEILAGALQDRGRAVLVGSVTRGKGSVQYSYALSDGSNLHVTSALWYTPSRAEINGVGLTPDVPVEEPTGEEDTTLAAAIESLGLSAVPKPEASQ